jgi:hypothetical protein
MNTFKSIALSTSLLVSAVLAAQADNLIVNPDFNDLSVGAGQLNYNTVATGWTTAGYNFVFTNGSADLGVVGHDGTLKLWGPNDGSENGLTATGPTGGNYIGADGAYEVSAITQSVSNLVSGDTYSLSFYWGAAQQEGFTGDTTDKWTVSLGDQSFDTSVISLPSHGFSGWVQTNFTFTATAATETLSFLATGTPNGEPPFALLTGVDMEDTSSPSPTPEPSALQYGSLALLGLAAGARRIFRKSTQA